MTDIIAVLPQVFVEGNPKNLLKVKYIDNGDGSFSQAVTLLGGGTSETSFAVRMLPDAGNPALIYVGKAPVGSVESAAVWQIKRMNTTTMLEIEWPASSSEFNQVWDDRESLSYA